MGIDGILGIILLLLICIFLYRNKSKVTIHKVLFPVFYVIQYTDKVGIKFMEFCARPKHFWHLMTPLIIVSGFLGMFLVLGQLVYNLIKSLFFGGAAEAVGIVQPFVPNVPGTIFVPLLYFLVSIFIIATVHEFCHGILSFAYDLKVKSSGFAFVSIFVPVIPAAFVEPDEKKLRKRPTKEQLAIFAAGPFANLVLALITIGLLASSAHLVDKMFVSEGLKVVDFVKDNNITYPAEASGIKKGELILTIDGNLMLEQANLSNLLSKKNPGDKISVNTNVSDYVITLAANPKNASKAFMGITSEANVVNRPEFVAQYGTMIPDFARWFFGLLIWLFVLSLGVGLFNLLPLGPIDGGRMWLAVLQRYQPEKKAQRIWVSTAFITLGLIIINILLGIFR